MSIGFTQLRAFHAVAERGGFTAAAQALGISQPTVTTQVKELETSYGVELFVRKGRRVELTETGTALFDVARRIMSFRNEAHEVLAAHGRFDTGHLRLATVGPFHATEIIAAFRREYPKIKISTVLGNSERTLKHLIDFDADVAILAHAADDPRVEMVPYRVHRVVVFVNGEHPWFHRSSVRMAELADQPFVLRERGSTTRRAFEMALREQGLAIEPVFEIDSREGVWKAVERGLGISVVADFEFVAHPNLRALEIEDRTIRTEYRIAYLRDRRSAPLLRAFLHVVEELKRHYSEGVT
jgi:aminoethylphosphonate catabolism LysR family transcriptional regulator